LLNLEFSPAVEPRLGWMEAVINHRLDAARKLTDSPSLRRKLEATLATCYRNGGKLAALRLRHDGIPPAAPSYTLDQIFDEDWWPANRHGLS